MRILFLSPVQPLLTPGDPLPRWQMQASWVRALGRLGHEVRVVKYRPDDRIRLGWGERIKWNLRVVREVGEVRGINLIIYSLGADVLTAQTVHYIKSKLKAPLVVLSGVSPILDGNPRERAMAPLVDLAATNDEGHAHEWLRLGAKRAAMLPISAIDPELAAILDGVSSIRSARDPRSLRRRFQVDIKDNVLLSSSSMISETPSSTRQKRKRFLERDIDVLFIGTLTEERKKFFKKLRRLLPSEIKIMVKEFVWEEEYAQLMSRAKIGINLLRPEMKHGANLRTFEIPAFGAMEITSFCRDEWLAAGKEIEVFSSAEEAAELVKKYLGNDGARKRMAAAGQERVMKEHTFDERAERLMEMVDDDPRRHFFDTLGSESSLTSSSPPRKSESEVLSGFSSMVSKMPSSDHHGVRIDVSVCIVNYKVDKELGRCVGSIKKFTKGVSYEIITVDNSVDNRWYSGGNNLGLKRAGGKYVLFLNPDCWLENDVIAELVNFMDEHPRAGAAEPRQVYESGKVAPTGSLLPKWWIDAVEMTGLSGLFGRLGNLGILGRLGRLGKFGELDKYRQIQFDRKQNFKTDVISGAAMIVRRDILDKIGGFDERLRLYYTDVDLCRRIKNAGWEIWHVGETAVGHKTRGSTSKLPWEKVNQIYAEDAREYYRKWGEGTGGNILYRGMKGNSIIIKIINAIKIIKDKK